MKTKEYHCTAEQRKDGRYALFLYAFLPEEIIVYENLYHRDLTRVQAAFLRSRYFDEYVKSNLSSETLEKEWGFLESIPKEGIKNGE